jgi:hypothetical protein
LKKRIYLNIQKYARLFMRPFYIRFYVDVSNYSTGLQCDHERARSHLSSNFELAGERAKKCVTWAVGLALNGASSLKSSHVPQTGTTTLWSASTV